MGVSPIWTSETASTWDQWMKFIDAGWCPSGGCPRSSGVYVRRGRVCSGGLNGRTTQKPAKAYTPLPVGSRIVGLDVSSTAAGIAVMDVEPHKLKVVDLQLFKPTARRLNGKQSHRIQDHCRNQFADATLTAMGRCVPVSKSPMVRVGHAIGGRSGARNHQDGDSSRDGPRRRDKILRSLRHDHRYEVVKEPQKAGSGESDCPPVSGVCGDERSGGTTWRTPSFVLVAMGARSQDGGRRQWSTTPRILRRSARYPRGCTVRIDERGFGFEGGRDERACHSI